MSKEVNSIIADLRQKKIRPLYFFCGEEDFFIDQLTDAMEQYVLPEAEKVFNLSVIYGKDANAQTILETCRRLPMMADRQLVIIKESQQLHHTVWDNEMLLAYIKKPVTSTVLVFAYRHGKPDKRKAFGKDIQKQALYFETTKIYDNQVPAFARDLAKQQGAKIEDAAINLLAEYTGVHNAPPPFTHVCA